MGTSETKTTALRQFLHRGVEEYIFHLTAQGRLSKGKAAEMLGASIYDVQRIAQTLGVALGPSADQEESSLKTLRGLVK
ncbi:hypothetical protein HYU14_06350 [Candidatus Woesearchaeota archaeon]|nr:hypothetical protein [Candidatus Woesearchaeota archaeon]